MLGEKWNAESRGFKKYVLIVSRVSLVRACSLYVQK